MSLGDPIGDDDLHAYVDDRQAPEQQLIVERPLRDHPEASARVRADPRDADPVALGRAPDAATLPAASVALALTVGTRAGFAPPDLEKSGYQLMGGRITLTEQGAGCLYLYDDQAGSRLTLFVRSMHGRDLEAPMRPPAMGGISGFVWARKGVGFSLIADRPMPVLDDISDHVQNERSGDA